MKSVPAGRIVFGLSALLNHHSKRIGYYLNLVDNSKDIELVLLFNKYVTQSKEYSQRLYAVLAGYNNGDVKLTKSSFGSMVKQFLKNLNAKERNEVLNECEMLEREGLKIYRVATMLSFLPLELEQEVRKQKESSEDALRTFMMLRGNKIDVLQIVQ
jgi:hypothetical protein